MLLTFPPSLPTRGRNFRAFRDLRVRGIFRDRTIVDLNSTGTGAKILTDRGTVLRATLSDDAATIVFLSPYVWKSED